MRYVVTANNAVGNIHRDILPVGQLFGEPNILVVAISSPPDRWGLSPLDKRV
jgi:hypothetical protein